MANKRKATVRGASPGPRRGGEATSAPWQDSTVETVLSPRALPKWLHPLRNASKEELLELIQELAPLKRLRGQAGVAGEGGPEGKGGAMGDMAAFEEACKPYCWYLVRDQGEMLLGDWLEEEETMWQEEPQAMVTHRPSREPAAPANAMAAAVSAGEASTEGAEDSKQPEVAAPELCEAASMARAASVGSPTHLRRGLMELNFNKGTVRQPFLEPREGRAIGFNVGEDVTVHSDGVEFEIPACANGCSAKITARLWENLLGERKITGESRGGCMCNCRFEPEFMGAHEEQDITFVCRERIE